MPTLPPRRAALLLAPLLLAACAGEDAPAAVPFVCDDGTRLAARFLAAPPRVLLELDGRRRVLPQVLAASGARYLGDGVLFWNKGRQARLERPGREATTCTEE